MRRIEDSLSISLPFRKLQGRDLPLPYPSPPVFVSVAHDLFRFPAPLGHEFPPRATAKIFCFFVFDFFNFQVANFRPRRISLEPPSEIERAKIRKLTNFDVLDLCAVLSAKRLSKSIYKTNIILTFSL